MADSTLPLPVLGSLLFTLMGPIAVIPLFARVAGAADAATKRKIAFNAYGVALVTLALAVFVGAGAMAAVGTSPPALIIGAGLILTLTALRNILGTASGEPAVASANPTTALGFSPIAIPGLVTPMSVAVLIIFVSYFPSTADKIAIMGVVLGIMTLNLGAMFAAGWFMRVIGAAPLLVLGAVFGVLQVAMGIEMIVSGLMRSRLLL